MHFLTSKQHSCITALLLSGVVLLALVPFISTNAPRAHAAPNYQINYQGKLLNASNVAVGDGTYNMRFWLTTSPSVATTSAVWTEELTGTNQVTVTNGLFSVMLGSTTPLTGVDFNQTLYLGVEIGGTSTPAWDGEMSPRKILGTVPAAFYADQASSSRLFAGIATSSFLRSDIDDTANGLLTFTGGFISTASSTVGGGTQTTGLTISGGATTTGNMYIGGQLLLPATTSSPTASPLIGVQGQSGIGINLVSNSTIDFIMTDVARVRFSAGRISGSNDFTIGSSAAAPDVFLRRDSTNTDLYFAFDSQSNERFRFTDSGEFSIGSTSPSSVLTVVNNVDTVTGTPLLTIASTTGGTATTTLLTVTSSGNVGVRTTNPQTLFQVTNDVATSSLGSPSTTPKAALVSFDNVQLSNLEGGQYFGRVGVRETPLALTNYGVSWTARASSTRWYGVSVSSDGRIVTLVENVFGSGFIYTSTDYGVTWTNRGTSQGWQSVAMSADGRIQTAVASAGFIYTSTDYGATWTARDSSRAWGSVAVSSDGRIQTATVSGGQIYTSTDYGVTWTARDSSRDWGSVAMSSDGRVQTAVLYTAGTGLIYTSTDYGVTWTARGTGNQWRDVALSSDGRIQTAVAGVGYIYTSTDYGVTWTARDSSRNWYGVGVSSDGRIQTAVNNSGYIYTSTDYGVTWTATGPSGGWEEVAMSSDGRIQIAVPSFPADYVYVSTASSFTTGNFAIGTSTVDSIFILASSTGTTLLKLTNAGYLGIGTTTPTSLLTVAGDARIGGTLTLGNLTATGTLSVSGLTTLGFASTTALTVSGNSYFGGVLSLTGSAANIALGSNWLSGDGDDEGVYVGSTGYVGIGTSSPAYNLDVVGPGHAYIRVRSSDPTGARIAGIQLQDRTFSAWLINHRAALDTPNNRLSFMYEGQERFTLLSDGNVGIGSTSPNAKLVIDTGTASAVGLNIRDVSGQTAALTTWTRSDGLPLGAFERGADTYGQLTLYGAASTSYAKLGGGSALTIDSGVTGKFRFAPSGNDIYFQNMNSSGSVYFSGNGGVDLTGNILFKSTGDIRFGTAAGAASGLNITMQGSTGYLGIGTTTPNQLLSVAGNMHLTGALYDRTYSAGTNGMVLKTTASGVEWVATSTLGLGGVSFTDSAGLASNLSDETGTGFAVFSGSPTFTGTATFANATVGSTATATDLVATGTIRIVGGTSWPTNPQEGTMFYSTASTTLYIYEGGKWQQDRNTATVIVAASDTQNKEKADYVATGTNDQDTIESALATLPSHGGLVYLLPGTYNINNEINIGQSSTTLMGSGPSTLLKVTATSTSWDVIDVTSRSFVTIRDLAIDGSSAVAGNQDGIRLSSVSFSSVVGVTVQRMRQYGISVVSSSEYNTISDNRVSNNTISGLYLNSVTKTTVSRNVVRENPNVGIWLDSSSGQNTLTSNTVNSNTYGIWLGASANNNGLTANTVESNAQYGITLVSALYNNINGNVVRMNGRYGIYLSSSSNSSITGNNLYGNGAGGGYASIYLSVSDDNLISGNTIQATSTDALIQVADSTSDRNTVANNQYINADTTTYISDAGTGTRYDDYDRVTLGTPTSRSYSIFNLNASSSSSTAEIRNQGTGSILDLYNTSSRVLTVTNAGRLGIGTTSPNNLLEVFDLISFSSTDFTTKLGYQAGKAIASGAQYNTYVGYLSGYGNTSTNAADSNSGFGAETLYNISTGVGNTALGYSSMYSMTDGSYNTAIGYQAGRYITSGNANNTSGSSVYLGYDTRASADGNTNEIVIGASTRGAGSNTVTLGNTSITKTLLSGNVGIGTTTPNSLLTITNSVGTTAGTPLLTIASTTGGTATTTLLTVTSSGNVGVRTTNPQTLFQVTNDVATSSLGSPSTTPKAALVSFDNVQLSNLEGGQYFGRVGVRETPLALTNYGVTWTARDSSRNWRGIAMSSDGRVQTAVNGIAGQIYTSTDYGVTWTARDSSRNWRGIAMSSDGRVQTAVGNGEQIYTSTDYGVTWTGRDSSRTWEAVAMSSDGRIQVAVVYDGQIYTSTDYGVTWTAGGASERWVGIALSSDGRVQTGIVNGSVGTGRLYTSTDYGATWTQRDSGKDWSGIAMSSDGRIQAAIVDGGQIYTSTDYGVTWTARDSSRNRRYGIAMSSDGRIQTTGLDTGQLYTSTDYGATWTARAFSQDWWDVAMSSDGRIQTAVVSGGQIYTSTADSFTTGNFAIGTSTVDSIFILASSTGTTLLKLTNAGYLGIGTTTPSSLLTVAGGARIGGLLTTGTLTATGTVTFSALGDGCLSTASGVVTSSGLPCGSGGGSSNWTFNGTRLTPSTTVGIVVSASSTIGDGTATGGLTVAGNATTTNLLHVLGTGTSTIAGNLKVGTGSLLLTSESIQNLSGSLVLQPSGGNVGIGTSTPSALLTVRLNDTTDAFLVTATSGTSWNAPFAVTKEGRVGIGTNAPSGLFQVFNHTASNDGITPALVYSRSTDGIAQNGIGTSMLFQAENNNDEMINAAGIAAQLSYAQDGSEQGALYFETGYQNSLSTVMTMTYLGNVGIGSTSPSRRLTVTGSGTTDPFIVASSSGSSMFLVGANGNVGIGTTSPNQKLTIFSDASDAAIEFSTVSGSAEKWTIGVDDSDGTKFKISSSSALGTNDKLVIDGYGRFGIGTSTPFYGIDMHSSSVNPYSAYLLRLAYTGYHGLQFVTWGSGSIIDTTVSNGNLYFGRDNTLSTFIVQSGNVGIGTTTPVSALTFAESTTAAGGITMGDVNLYRAASDVLFTNDSFMALGSIVSGLGMQTPAVYGSSTASGYLVLAGTSHSTKGNVLINPSGGYVGIGTTTPGDTLTVASSTGAGYVNIGVLAALPSYGGISFSGPLTSTNYHIAGAPTSADSSLYINRVTGGKIRFREAGSATDQFTIDAGGNVGIGSSSPVAQLVVSDGLGTNGNSEILSLQSAYGSGGQKALTWRDANNITGQIDTRWNGSDRVDMVFGHLYSSSAYQTSDLMVLTGDGKLGIGNTNPQSKLAVTGSSGGYTGAGTEGIFQITTGTGLNTDDKLQMGVVDGSYSWLQAIDPGNAVRHLVLQPSGASVGFVGIGTTTPTSPFTVDGGSSGAAVSVYSTSTGDGLRIYTAGAQSNNGILWYNGIGTKEFFNLYSSNNSAAMQLSDNGTAEIVLHTAGVSYLNTGYNFGLGDTSPDYKLDVWGTICQDTDSNDVCDGTVTSDARLKTNVVTITGDEALEKLSLLRGVEFDWNEDVSATEYLGRGIRQVGVIAQEVEAVFPSLIYTDMDGYRMVDYQKLTGPLISAVNELNLRLASTTLLVHRATSTIAMLASTTELLANASSSIISTGEGDTFWSRLTTLVQGFVDGVLTLVGVKADEVTTDVLCIGETCVDEATLKALLESANQMPSAPPSSDGSSGGGTSGDTTSTTNISTSTADSVPEEGAGTTTPAGGETSPEPITPEEPLTGGSAPSEPMVEEPAPVEESTPEPAPEPAPESPADPTGA